MPLLAQGWWVDGEEPYLLVRTRRPPPRPRHRRRPLIFHDLPDDLVTVMRAEPDAAIKSAAVFAEPWRLEVWPAVPSTVIASSEDRLVPRSLQRHSPATGSAVQTLPGGHLVAVSQPAALADRIAAVSKPVPVSPRPKLPREVDHHIRDDRSDPPSVTLLSASRRARSSTARWRRSGVALWEPRDHG